MQRINVQRKHLAIHFKNKLKKVFLQKMVKRTCRQVTSESSYLGREFSVQHHQTIVVLFTDSLQELIQTHFINSGPWIMTYWINLIIMAIWPINFSNKYRSWSKEEVWSKDLFNIQTMPNIKINLISATINNLELIHSCSNSHWVCNRTSCLRGSKRNQILQKLFILG